MPGDTIDDTNQHYITKAYLDRFVHPSTGQNVLFPYRKGGHACKPRGTKRLGSAINFYRQKVEGKLTDKLDKARNFSEKLLFGSGKRTPSAFSKCVFDDDFRPTQADRVELVAAAAFLFCGSPVQIHNTAMSQLLAAQIDLFNWLNTDEAKSEYRKKYGSSGIENLEKDREEILKGDLFVDVGEENWKQFGFSSFLLESDVIQLLMGMKMTVVDCHYRSFFLTSDNPAVRTFASEQNKTDDEMWFPVSFKRGILWHRKNLDEKAAFGHSQSRAMNRRLIKHAYKFVYSPLSDGWIESAVKSETFDPLLGHYGSLEKVIEHSYPVTHDGKPAGEIVDLYAAMKSGERSDVVGL